MPPRREALRRKQEILKMLALDLPHATIARANGVDERTVRRVKREAALWMAMRGVSA
jgi:DNA invertase Pin-like site-specific DNA recombinase